jgi:hypothetical protein
MMARPDTLPPFCGPRLRVVTGWPGGLAPRQEGERTMPDRRTTTLVAAALLGLGLTLIPSAAEADRDRGRHRGWSAYHHHHPWHPPGHGRFRGPPVVVVPPPVYRPPPVVVLPGYAVPHWYGYGPSWGYAPYGEAELRLRLPFR